MALSFSAAMGPKELRLVALMPEEAIIVAFRLEPAAARRRSRRSALSNAPRVSFPAISCAARRPADQRQGVRPRKVVAE
jgi:hypothetical protein